MNIAYIIDLNNILKEEDLHIPHVDGLHYNSMYPSDLTASKIVEIRDVVMRRATAGEDDKHLFFFVIENNKEVLTALSACFNDIQKDQDNFRQDCELHVVCNFVKDDNGSFSLEEYEKKMPSLKKNEVCVYSWLLGKYEYAGYKPVSVARRAHAIVRFIWMLTKHYKDISPSLLSMTLDTEEAQPIYNLFGDACVFFDEGKRNKAVSDYYCYKNLQYLLNLPDGEDFDEYYRNNVLPYKDDKKELDKKIDATSDGFLQEQRSQIEASVITEKTQGLLIKSSDDDKEYLVSATDNKLVFIDDLSKNGDWKLPEMELFISNYEARVGRVGEIEETNSKEFVKELYNKYIIHKRDGFDSINNMVSESRKQHIETFKDHVNQHLNGFLNQNESGNHVSIYETLTPQEANQHRSNIDYGIAFMEYLVSGKGDYLIDQDVSMGDTNFTAIKEAIEQEEKKRRKEYEDKNNEIERLYKPQGDEQKSRVEEQFESIDNRIKTCHSEKQRCDYQLDHWIDGDANRKLTARTWATIAIGSGVVAALLWIFTSIKYLSGFMNNSFENYERFQWSVFGAFILLGVVVGIAVLLKASRRKKEAEVALENARKQKKSLMEECVEEIKSLNDKHYKYLLSYHGLKTMDELIEFATWKKEYLESFRKTIFKLMLQYRLSAEDDNRQVFDDDNTVELTDTDVKSILFGSEGNNRQVPYGFAQGGIVLSDAFDHFKRKKIRFETTRNSLTHTSQKFDQVSLEKEVIACMREHEGIGIEYTALEETSVLPESTDGVEMDDVNQGYCGDCYFMATLAAIARVKPEYIVGKRGMVESLGDEHRFFRVKFYDKDKKRVNVDVDNRFWNKDGQPYYAGKGKPNNPEGASYDPWVMAVEKAWAKANEHGYDGIEGGSVDGKEYVRKVEYSFAVTGESAFYCMTKNVPDSIKLLNMMKKHFLEDHLPITFYSAHKDNPEFSSTDCNLVHYHAYALKTIHDDDTFDIFNPWNSHSADENVYGKHYEKVDIDFIRNNFEVVVFFGIEEVDFDSFERTLTDNTAENEVKKDIEKLLMKTLGKLDLGMHKFEDLLTDDEMKAILANATYLFSKNIIADIKGVGNSRHLLFVETSCNGANQKMRKFFQTNLPSEISLQDSLFGDDDRSSLTLFRLSPHYVLDNFR